MPSPPQEREQGPQGSQGPKPPPASEQSPAEQDSFPCTQVLETGQGVSGRAGWTSAERGVGKGPSPKGQERGLAQASCVPGGCRAPVSRSRQLQWQGRTHRVPSALSTWPGGAVAARLAVPHAVLGNNGGRGLWSVAMGWRGVPWGGVRRHGREGEVRGGQGCMQESATLWFSSRVLNSLRLSVLCHHQSFCLVPSAKGQLSGEPGSTLRK